MPGSLLEQVDGIARLEHRNRSEFIRAAMRLYLRIKRHRELLAQMERGYAEMADLNLELAEVEPEDGGDWEAYERYLMECDGGAGKQG